MHARAGALPLSVALSIPSPLVPFPLSFLSLPLSLNRMLLYTKHWYSGQAYARTHLPLSPTPCTLSSLFAHFPLLSFLQHSEYSKSLNLRKVKAINPRNHKNPNNPYKHIDSFLDHSDCFSYKLTALLTLLTLI